MPAGTTGTDPGGSAGGPGSVDSGPTSTEGHDTGESTPATSPDDPDTGESTRATSDHSPDTGATSTPNEHTRHDPDAGATSTANEHTRHPGDGGAGAPTATWQSLSASSFGSGAGETAAGNHPGSDRHPDAGGGSGRLGRTGTSPDERAAAEHQSYLSKTEHYEVVLKAGDMERVLPKLAWHLDEPRVGQSYPNYYVAQLAYGLAVLFDVRDDEQLRIFLDVDLALEPGDQS